VFAVVVALIAVALMWLLRAHPLARGLVVGGWVAGTSTWLWSIVVQLSGSSPAMLGDHGEQWTAQELRKLRRSGWRVINHVVLRRWDIDHVLVGPGGVYAIETKWSAEAWMDPCRREGVVRALDRAAGNARDLRLLLRPHGVTEVRSVIFLWGGANQDVRPHQRGASTVLSGRFAGQWRDALPGSGMSADQVEQVWAKIEAACCRRDPLEDEQSSLLR
jgi:hypothetical protein